MRSPHRLRDRAGWLIPGLAGTLGLFASCGSRADFAPPDPIVPGEPSTEPDAHVAPIHGRARLYAHYETIETPDAGQADSVEDFQIRRADLTLSGSLLEHWSYRFKGDVRTGELDVQDLTISYDTGFATLSMGQLGPIDELTVPAYREFMEGAGLEAAFAPQNQLGVYALHESTAWTMAAGVFKGALDPRQAEEGWTYAARFTFAPSVPNGYLLHVGGYLSRRTGHSGEAVYAYSARSLLRTGERFVDTGAIADGDRLFGLELSAGAGPVSFESQCAAVRASIVQQGGSTARFHGCYAAALWFLTGESRNYGNGGFSRADIQSPVSEGGPGAWQAGVRFDTLDLEDGVIFGGSQRGWSFALNWYLDDQFWLSANYSRTKINVGVGEPLVTHGAAMRLHYQIRW
ncbi:MAG TPA: porin [Woeseiaceae bacterium]|nr:porin [Woeseiaceae bacterium]